MFPKSPVTEHRPLPEIGPPRTPFPVAPTAQQRRQCTHQIRPPSSVQPSVAKLILVNFHWKTSDISERHKSNPTQLLVEARVQPKTAKNTFIHSSHHCGVCLQSVRKENLLSLPCHHPFCRSCWEQHSTVLVKDGIGVGISCMAQDCLLRTPEDFAFPLISNEELREKYRRYLFRDYVERQIEAMGKQSLKVSTGE
ncbi:E3 ubiquitin-protein ligase ARIH2-like [Rhincodon typus]|uniref:E3 ubiquitin-protein ligase ARIH2-like n=1 Tax=Rhincodon typus TaxID=259920 RepID=UPI00202EC799|nr:E3 ubiquitin-protein ligase ARIH2-like [Rhincodon typus]